MSDNTTEDKPLVLRLYVDGESLDAHDIPGDVFTVGAKGFPKNGFDHEAHEAATKVLNLLKDEYDWAEDLTGCSLGY